MKPTHHNGPHAALLKYELNCTHSLSSSVNIHQRLLCMSAFLFTHLDSSTKLLRVFNTRMALLTHLVWTGKPVHHQVLARAEKEMSWQSLKTSYFNVKLTNTHWLARLLIQGRGLFFQYTFVPLAFCMIIQPYKSTVQTESQKPLICTFGTLILSCYNPHISYSLPLCHITGGSFLDLPKGFQILKLSSYWVWEGDGSLYDSWEWQSLLG